MNLRLPTDKRSLAAMLLAVLLLTAIALALNTHRASLPQQPQPPASPAADAPTARSVDRILKPLTIVRTGTLESAGSLPVTADFTGQLKELYVKNGQAVKAGQPLLVLQATDEPQSGEPAPAAPSAQAQADYEAAQKEVNRLQKLYDIGGISRKQFEAAAARLQEAKTNLSAPASVKSASVPKGTLATVAAPIDGIVANLSAANGTTVQAGQKLLALGSGHDVEAVVRLAQNDLYLTHLGAPARITSGQNTVAGQVSKIYPQIETNQAPAFLAHVKLLSNPDGLFRAGQPVTVKLDTGKTAEVQAVPTTALLYDNQGQTFLFLVVDGKAHRQAVLAGEAVGNFTEITSELPPSSYVLAPALASIKDGDRIATP